MRRLLDRGAQISEVATKNHKPSKKARLTLKRKRQQQKNSRHANR